MFVQSVSVFSLSVFLWALLSEIKWMMMMVITASRWACRWRASNHSAFWGLTLDEGIRYRLGTFRPTIPVNKMTTLRVFADDALPATFDAREEWPSFIEAVLDQGNCASSWAFSTTGQ